MSIHLHVAVIVHYKCLSTVILTSSIHSAMRKKGGGKCFMKERSSIRTICPCTFAEAVNAAVFMGLQLHMRYISCADIFPYIFPDMQLCADRTAWDSLNNCLDYALSFTFFNFCQVIYYNASKWKGRDVKWHKKKCQLFPTKTLNMSIDSDVQGGVCTCMCEGRSDQWRFPLLSSAQQQMGRGCGLVGWVTRIMNLPVVLFNTKKEKRKQKHIQQSTLAFIERSKQATRR